MGYKQRFLKLPSHAEMRRRKAVKQNKTPQTQATKHSMAPKVIQPPGAYPRFSYNFYFKEKNGGSHKIIACAYDDATAKRQAESLAVIFNYTFVKVKCRQRMNWTDYKSAQRTDWFKLFQRDWKRAGENVHNIEG